MFDEMGTLINTSLFPTIGLFGVSLVRLSLSVSAWSGLLYGGQRSGYLGFITMAVVHKMNIIYTNVKTHFH